MALETLSSHIPLQTVVSLVAQHYVNVLTHVEKSFLSYSNWTGTIGVDMKISANTGTYL